MKELLIVKLAASRVLPDNLLLIPPVADTQLLLPADSKKCARYFIHRDQNVT